MDKFENALVWKAKTELFENADVITVMCAHALSCISAFLGTKKRFSLDGKHFICFRGGSATGLMWTENILCVFKLPGLVWTGPTRQRNLDS